MAQPFPISLLFACRSARVTVAEAMAVAKLLSTEVGRDARAGEAVRLPSIGDVRLEASGHVTWSHGRDIEPDQAGRGLARLLAALVAEAERCGDRVPAPLAFALARAIDDHALVPLESLHDLDLVLDRLAPADPLPVTAAFAERAGSRVAAMPVERIETVTDLRRARRARGLSLPAIGAETGIPLTLLRELEWGVFDNWPHGPQTEASLRAYARAAGLPSDAVLDVVLGPAPQPVAVEVPRLPVWVVAGAALILSGAAAATWMSRYSVPELVEPRPPGELITHVGPTAPVVPEFVAVPDITPSRPAASERAPARRVSGKRTAVRPPVATSAPRPDTKRKFWDRPVLVIKFGKQ
jgi:hypothetical protein